MRLSTIIGAIAVASSSVTAKTIKVAVGVDSKGQPGLVYTPDNVKAAVGDIVEFSFEAGNHTATQSTFDNPCKSIASVDSTKKGFASGFMPVAQGSEDFETFNYTIADTKPIWVYCGQGPHCLNGMSMVINENSTSEKTLDAYKEAAANPDATTPTTGEATPTPTPTDSGAAYGFVSLAMLAGALVLAL